MLKLRKNLWISMLVVGLTNTSIHVHASIFDDLLGGGGNGSDGGSFADEGNSLGGNTGAIACTTEAGFRQFINLDDFRLAGQNIVSISETNPLAPKGLADNQYMVFKITKPKGDNLVSFSMGAFLGQMEEYDFWLRGFNYNDIKGYFHFTNDYNISGVRSALPAKLVAYIPNCSPGNLEDYHTKPDATAAYIYGQTTQEEYKYFIAYNAPGASPGIGEFSKLQAMLVFDENKADDSIPDGSITTDDTSDTSTDDSGTVVDPTDDTSDTVTDDSTDTSVEVFPIDETEKEEYSYSGYDTTVLTDRSLINIDAENLYGRSYIQGVGNKVNYYLIKSLPKDDLYIVDYEGENKLTFSDDVVDKITEYNKDVDGKLVVKFSDEVSITVEGEFTVNNKELSITSIDSGSSANTLLPEALSQTVSGSKDNDDFMISKETVFSPTIMNGHKGDDIYILDLSLGELNDSVEVIDLFGNNKIKTEDVSCTILTSISTSTSAHQVYSCGKVTFTGRFELDPKETSNN